MVDDAEQKTSIGIVNQGHDPHVDRASVVGWGHQGINRGWAAG